MSATLATARRTSHSCRRKASRWACTARTALIALTATAGLARAQTTPTSPASSVQIYGIISLGVAQINNVGGGSQVRVQNALNFPNYVGFRGTEDLGGGNAAQFAIASNINVATGVAGQGASFWNKNAWVGLSNRQWGAFAIGRNDEFGGEQCFTTAFCWAGLIYNLHPGNLDHIGGGQLANMVKYISPELGAYRFRSFYAFSDNSTGTHAGRAIGLEGIYRGESLAVTATFESINGPTISPASATTGIGLTRFFGLNATPTTVFALDQQNIYLLGARYGIGNFLLYATATDVVLKYKGQKNALKTYETGLTYNFTPLLSLTGACFHSTYTTSTLNNCGAELTYLLSKRTSIFAADTAQRVSGPFQKSQMFQASGPSSTQAQNAIAAGIRHSF